MLIKVSPQFADTQLGSQGAKIIKKCVHRGFCNTHCPTFLATGDTNMSPRGRIYLIKEYLQGKSLTQVEMASIKTCVGCRSCETDCPGGVKVARLIELAKVTIEHEYPQSSTLKQRLMKTLCKVLPSPQTPLLMMSSIARDGLNSKRSLYVAKNQVKARISRHNPVSPNRTLVLVTECTKAGLARNAHHSAQYILENMGYRVIELPKTHCCGAFKASIGESSKARQQARENIDAWWGLLSEESLEIVTISSSCEAQLKQYGNMLRCDKRYADKANYIARKTINIAELINKDRQNIVHNSRVPYRVAMHIPCSLRHRSDKHRELIQLVSRLPVIIDDTERERVCCGSGGTYSLFYPELASRIGTTKISDLTLGKPDYIVTANTGCQYHMGKHTDIPVIHWLELVFMLMQSDKGTKKAAG
ncbi:heterodisulfide reductase-related iron-sulfur binding cluster [Vibrio astriarenae]|uniref:heterodisulfide reductase-related iron-sulfur binding cluster n=1 Tax=Vibrio astriarenae TaxID=1481923 RepID=UPI003735FCE9